MARESASERLRWVFDLYEFGEEMVRAKIRRRFPRSSERAMEARITECLDRPRCTAKRGRPELACPRREGHEAW